jgi:hypothetical protein
MLFFVAIGVGIEPIATNEVYVYWYSTITLPIGSAVFSLLGFYILSASYRAFKIRTFETAVFLIVGVLIIMYNAPIMTALWSGFNTIGAWILEVPNLGGQRAIIIGAGLGVIILALRTLLGRETGWLGSREAA